MSSRKIAQFGTWESPITLETITRDDIRISESEINTSNGKIYYMEERPSESGRSVIVEHFEGGVKDVLPKGYNARTAVHEYGGAAMTLGPNGKLVFSDWETRGVFSIDAESGEVKPLVDANKKVRFADFDVHPMLPKWILAIQEDHQGDEVLNCLVVINGETKEVSTLTEGSDFYSQAKFNPAGDKICWIEWNHPDMPWTGTVLYTAEWNNGTIEKKTLIAGKARVESISQPRWNLDGSLLFVSDRTGYWQLYHLTQGSSKPQLIKLKGLEDAEFSAPAWFLGSCTYVPLTSNTLAAAITQNAANRLIIIDIEKGTYSDPKFPLVELRFKAIRRVSTTEILAIGKTATSPLALYFLDITKPGAIKLIKSSSEIDLPQSLFSKASHISFPRIYDNKEGQGHCFFLPPQNPGFEAPAGTLPPLIVTLHGGPTAHTPPGLELVSQYWTSRGYAVVAINYAGSSGYGRAYRDSLNGKWGISDVEDTANCIAHLSSQKLIDPTRIGIIGGSAGGYGVLAALCDYPTVFAGGASLYGIGNVRTLVADTHKFESRYADTLLFPDGATEKEREKIMNDRSPCNRAGKIRAPTLLLQGLDDKVVPPNQAIEMEKAITESGGVVRLVMFEGEGHGFRQGKSVLKAKQEEEEWWKKNLLKL